MRRRPTPPNWLDQATGWTVLVTTTSDDTYRGIMLDQFADGLCLVAASAVRAGERPVPIAGEFFIPAGKIKCVQRPPVEEVG